MRGPPSIPRRAGVRPQIPNEAVARVRAAVPAPYNGWVARGNLANMPPLSAIVLDNWFPGVQDVSIRGGSIAWSTGYGANIRTLMGYSGPDGTDKLFAATSAGIYDATAQGVVGAVVQAATNAFWSFANFSNSGGNWLVMVNGTDPYTIFSGSAWSQPALTGVSGATLNYVTVHQRRLWFAQKNSMNLWYLDVEAISGQAYQFPVGALFKKGGYIVAIGSWTVDSGAGKDDMLVIITSNGQIAVYSGTDPSSIITWSLIGVYDAIKPLGSRPLVDFGGDLLYLSNIGLTPMTRIAQSSFFNASDEISYAIDGAFRSAADSYRNNFGWQMITHKAANMLVVNIPATSDTLSYQYVMNTITKAWCRFTNWNAACWVSLGNDIYFAGGTTVTKANVGTNDNGAPIVAKVAQAYNNLGYAMQKKITLTRPNIGFSSNANLQMALDADFRTFGGQTTINYSPLNGAAIWDSSLWDTGLWDNGSESVDPKWTSIPGDLGYLHSFRMQVTTSVSNVTWTSTDYTLVPAGIL